MIVRVFRIVDLDIAECLTYADQLARQIIFTEVLILRTIPVGMVSSASKWSFLMTPSYLDVICEAVS